MPIEPVIAAMLASPGGGSAMNGPDASQGPRGLILGRIGGFFVSTTRRLLGELRALRRQLRNAGGRREAKPQARPAFDEILAAIEPHLLSLGITRVGELTGLDVVGVPVFFASRPNSRALSVCQGKGLSEGQRTAGAIMEGVEQALAERHEDLVSNGRARTRWRRAGLTASPSTSMLRSASGEDDSSSQARMGRRLVDGRAAGRSMCRSSSSDSTFVRRDAMGSR